MSPLSAYPSPFNFGPAPTMWRRHDEAFTGIALGNVTVPASGAAECEGRLAIGGDFLPARGFSVGISGGGTFVVGPAMNFDNLIVPGAATGISFDFGVLTQNAGMTPADLGIDLDAIFSQLQTKSACPAEDCCRLADQDTSARAATGPWRRRSARDRRRLVRRVAAPPARVGLTGARSTSRVSPRSPAHPRAATSRRTH